MLKQSLLLGVLLVWALLRAQGGPVSLEPAEIKHLRLLVTTNDAAGRQFSSVRRVADAALRTAPHPIEQIVSEGHLEKDPLKIRTEAALPDLDKIAALAWTWAVTDDERYATKAREFILAWATVNRPDGDAINESKFEPLIVGYDLVRGTFAEADRRRVDDWLREKATVLGHSKRGLTDNWYSHRLKVVGLVGWVIGDPALTTEAVAGFHQQISRNFKPDGASTDFYKRDALHYHIYDVEPLLTLARTAERAGQPLFDYEAANGVTLQRAVDFVVPYARGEKTHIEFAKSTVAFDLKRAANGQSEYVPHPWKPRAAVELFSQAAWFHPEYATLAETLAGHPGETLFNWQMVLNAAAPRKG